MATWGRIISSCYSFFFFFFGFGLTTTKEKKKGTYMQCMNCSLEQVHHVRLMMR